jgi:2-haloacid dehalogenase
LVDRREFLTKAAALASAALLAAPARAVDRPAKFAAIAFDAFPIFDPRPVFARAEALFPGRGAELGREWRTRQFEYAWLRALAGRYADFWQVTEDALVFAARLLKLDLTAEKRARLMQAHLDLGLWPDVPAALDALRDRAIRLVFLSNLTPRMLEAAIGNAGIEGRFEQILSTDAVRTYKPDPRGYRMAIDHLGLAREEILFAAFAGWDASGAKAFGYPTFWVNRLGLPAEELGILPDGSGATLADLVAFLGP